MRMGTTVSGIMREIIGNGSKNGQCCSDFWLSRPRQHGLIGIEYDLTCVRRCS
jgi:hypothetical protein